LSRGKREPRFGGVLNQNCRINKCIKSIIGGINGIIFHDNLKGEYKQQCKTIGEKYNVYCGKHKILKTSDELIKIMDTEVL
jgi:hypothetical protein